MAQIILSLFTAIAFTMNFAPCENSSMEIQSIYSDLLNGFGGTAFETTVLWGLLSFTGKKLADKIGMRGGKLIYPLSVFLAIVWVMGKSYQIDNTLNALHCSWIQIIKSIIYVIGMTWFLIQIAYLCFSFLNKREHRGIVGKVNWWNKIHEKHPFIVDYIFVSLGALPQLAACYPAGMSYDARLSLLYYFDLIPFTSHHPPFSTWVMGKTVSLGLLFGSGNLGVFFYCILQYILFCVLVSYLIYTIRTCLQAPEWLQIFTLITAVIAPYHAAYVGVMIKDVIYSYMVVLLVIESIYFVKCDYCSKRHYVLMSIASVVSILYRYNGKYVVYPTLIVLITMACHRKKKQKVIRVLLVTISVVLVSTSVESYFMRYYVEKEGSIREALSLPFQQTARYIKQYEDEVTTEEKKIIDKVLDYESLAEVYDPTISDPVKATFRDTATKKDLLLYFQVWFRQFFQHPWCYVETTINQNYFIVFPMTELHAYFSEVTYEEPLFKMLEDYLDLHEVDSLLFQRLSSLQALYVGAALLFPGIGMLSNIGVYNILLLFIIAFAVDRRYNNTIVVSVPLVLTNMIVIAAPYVGPRYLFPVLYSMPCIIALFIEENRKIPEGVDK